MLLSAAYRASGFAAKDVSIFQPSESFELILEEDEFWWGGLSVDGFRMP